MPNFNFIAVQPNSTGLKLDTSELVNGANTVERQNICFTDPASAVNITAVQTKGSQGSYAIPTQDLKDSGRVSVCLSSYIAGANNSLWVFSTTEVMLNMAITKLGAAMVTASSYTVTPGKTLRLQSFTFWAYHSTGNYVQLTLRGNSSGTVSLTSNVLMQLPMVIMTWLTAPSIIIPDGFEIPGGTSIGFSGLTNVGTGYVTGVFAGYEY